MRFDKIEEIEREVNILDIMALVVILVGAFYMQFFTHELPCPLCLLQRLGFLMIGLGFILNLRFGIRPLHYGISLLAALFTVAVALRQVLLHIAPEASGVTGYGEALFGLHMYTWSLLFAVGFILWIGFHLLFPKQFSKIQLRPAKWLLRLGYIVCVILILFSLLNVIFVFLECGIAQCPENPLHYRYLIGK